MKYNTFVCVFFSRLQRLRVYDMPAVKNKKLVALLLEESFPAGCVVEGVDFNAAEDEPSDHMLPSFLQRYEDIASAEARERTAVLESDRQFLDGVSSIPSTSSKQDGSDKLVEGKKC